MSEQTDKNLPLQGLKVIEMGQLIAGPFASKLLGEFGADVIKIEPPGWRPVAQVAQAQDGTSLWWHVQSRNKRSVTLDLKAAEGQKIVRQLVAEADILVENFRPGTLEEWGLGWDELSKLNPRLIMLRISGYGQTGPYRDLPGFGVIGEAMGGLRHLSGYPGQPPVRVGVSIGDSLSSLYGVIGVLLALQERNRSGQGRNRRGAVRVRIRHDGKPRARIRRLRLRTRAGWQCPARHHAVQFLSVQRRRLRPDRRQWRQHLQAPDDPDGPPGPRR